MELFNIRQIKLEALKRSRKKLAPTLALAAFCSSFILFGCNQTGGATAASAPAGGLTLTVTPSSTKLSTGSSVTLSASGGNGSYSYSVVSGGAGGSIRGSTYTAPSAVGSGSVTILASDSAGNSGTTTLTILSALTVSLTKSVVIAAVTSTASASGGSGSYTYSIVSGGAGGSIVSTTGVYTPGASTGTTTIKASDSATGKSGTATITINPALAISPTAAFTLATGDTKTFTITGGIPPYTYSSALNGAFVGPTYTASTTGSDTVTVTDSNATSVVSGTITVNPALTISPTTLKVSALQTATFVGANGTGSYSYSVVSGGAGGTITSAGGVYTAPSSAGTDTVKVTDSYGNTASAVVTALGTGALVSSGQSHTCRVNSGVLQCWGLNTSGQLGDGTTTMQESPESTSPGITFASVSAGYLHTCAITAAGVLMCTGSDTTSQLGDNAAIQRDAWEVVGSSGAPYAQVSAGESHTCAVSRAGGLYCWGDRTYGQVGDGTTMAASPVTTPTQINIGTQYARVAAGANHSCAITYAGALYCWGHDANGQVGNSATSAAVNTPTAVTTTGTSGFFNAISAGTTHSCAVDSTSKLFCWGGNADGQLGDGTTSDESAPEQINAGITYSNVSAGYESSCGVTSAGALKCWGIDTDSGLADGGTTQHLSPEAVDSSTVYSSVNVSAGDFFGCGVTSAGVFKCWGDNADGQVGIGSTINATTPQKVP